MAAKKIRRQDLKKDEVAETVEALVEDLQRHRTAILAVVGLLVLIVGGTVISTRHSQNVALENTRLLRGAHEALSFAVMTDDADQRRRELQAAADSLQMLVDKRGADPAGLHALYLQADIYYAMEDFDRAAATFENYIQKAKTPEDRARGEIALGQTYESQSFLDDDPARLVAALDRYERAAAGAPGDSYVHYHALLNQGRVLELQGEDDRALSVYRTIVENRPMPRADVPGADQVDSVRDSGNPFIESVLARAKEDAAQLSFAAQAQQRIDRIEAARRLGRAPAEAS
jgi:tetratricopeptide (TPR) repeat protein